jgi:hypothetical protein
MWMMTATNLLAQSDILRRGQSGIGVGIGYSNNRETGQYLISAGYSYKGFLDGSLTFSKANQGEVTQSVITPTVTFFPVKQEDADNVPTLGISLGFNHYVKTTTETVYAPNPDSTILSAIAIPLVQETTINAIKIGVTAERRIGYWNVWFFQPSIGARISISSAPWEFLIRAALSIGTRIVDGPIIVFTPAMEVQSGVTTASMMLRIVL